MAAIITLEDLHSQPFQCHFHWGLPYYSANLKAVTIIEAYKFRLFRSKLRENIVEQFAYHMSLAYTYYVEKHLEEYEVHVIEAKRLSQEDPGMFHVFQANFFNMLQGVGMSFQGKSIDSFVAPYQSLSTDSQAIIWAIRSLTLRALAPCSLPEAIKGYEKAISLDPKNYQWHLGVGDMKKKLQKADKGNYTTVKPELPHYEEAVRLGGPKLPLANTLSELSYDYLMAKEKSYTELKDLMQFIHDLMIEILQEETLLGEHYSKLGKFFETIPEPFKNTKLAKQCFEDALAIDPDNPVINHHYAKYLMRYKQDAMALMYLDKAVECSAVANFPAEMDLMQLRSDLYENYDFNKEVQELLRRYQAPDQKATLYCKLGDYLRKSQPTTALRLYQSALKVTEEAGFKDWGKSVYKYLWQQRKDGKGRDRITKKRYDFYDIHNEIALLEKEISRT